MIAEKVPRRIVTLWLEFLQGNHPAVKQFGIVREQLSQKLQSDPGNPFLITTLAFADACLGRNEESIQEARRAIEMRPVSEDAISGTCIAANVAMVHACANQLDSAFEQLDILIKMPVGLAYADLKLNPGWDPLRNDPRFDKLLAKLAPRD